MKLGSSPPLTISRQVSFTSLNSTSYHLHPSHVEIHLPPPASPNSLSPYNMTPPNCLTPQSLSPLPSPKRTPCLKRAKSWREEKEQRKKERRASLSPNLKMNEHYSNHNNNNNTTFHSGSVYNQFHNT